MAQNFRGIWQTAFNKPVNYAQTPKQALQPNADYSMGNPFAGKPVTPGNNFNIGNPVTPRFNNTMMPNPKQNPYQVQPMPMPRQDQPDYRVQPMPMPNQARPMPYQTQDFSNFNYGQRSSDSSPFSGGNRNLANWLNGILRVKNRW